MPLDLATSDTPVSPAELRATLSREVATAVKPLGEVLTLSREATAAMRAELERLEARFRDIKAEAGDLSRPPPHQAGPEAERLHEACEQAGAIEQRLAEAVGEAGERIEDLELRGGRLIRACDEVASRQDDLARIGDQQRAEMERISEMPLARIEAAADAAAARLESLIEQASEAAGRFERAAREHAAGELTLREAVGRLAPWEAVLDGSSPGPVEDMAATMRTELRQEMTSLGAGLAQLAEAVVALAQAQPARKGRRKAGAAPARRPAPARKPAAQVEAKPGRASASGRAATSLKSVVRGGRKKTTRRAGAGSQASARSKPKAASRKPAAKGARSKTPARAKAPTRAGRGKTRRAAASRR
jgi:hypothetical protein